MRTLALLFLAFICSNKADADILCHTSRMNKIFEIADKKVTFFDEHEYKSRRELASVASRSKSMGQGVTKIVEFENQKHIIHIADENSFSDINDYMIVKSKSGHEVTYPIICEKK